MPTLKKTARQQTAANIKSVFRYALAQKGWTQGHLAQLMGRDPKLISNAMNDPYKRDFGFLLDVADKLDVDFSKAIRGEIK